MKFKLLGSAILVSVCALMTRPSVAGLYDSPSPAYRHFYYSRSSKPLPSRFRSLAAILNKNCCELSYAKVARPELLRAGFWPVPAKEKVYPFCSSAADCDDFPEVENCTADTGECTMDFSDKAGDRLSVDTADTGSPRIDQVRDWVIYWSPKPTKKQTK